MNITGLIWLDDIVNKLTWKHEVVPEEVVEVIANRPHLRFIEKGHRVGEDMYAAYGRTDAGRKLAVFFV
ncbi:MAG: BrnT family toxin [Acidobacteriota bacterium]|nr:BrnT family toxin [Acidobacteriota bacterium]